LIYYIDASAAVKLIVAEAESIVLRRFVDDLEPPSLLLSSALLETETRRAAARTGVEQAVVSDLMAQIAMVYPERPDFVDAGLLPVAGLRSLDALHLVTALRAEANAMIAYDHRLLGGCRAVGIATISPS
jgi:predicted nucleic acid-binding protein